MDNSNKTFFFSVGLSSAITSLLAAGAIYIDGEYGFTLFILLPILIGALPAIIRSFFTRISLKECFAMGYTSLLVQIFILIIFAIEGLICIAMSLPLLLPMIALGCYLGYWAAKEINRHRLGMISIFLATPAFFAFDSQLTKHNYDYLLTPVTTSVLVNAPITNVWDLVVEFPEMEAPEELVFKAGISYPVRAKIEGEGVGAIRYCEFSTGAFVEPIDEWNAPYSLKFHVTEQPIPMKELSPYDIHPPHLDNYFISKKGQFQLSELGENKTLLEGTTWYYVRIRPATYWNWWSEYLIHTIHERVLLHIKAHAEKPVANS